MPKFFQVIKSGRHSCCKCK